MVIRDVLHSRTAAVVAAAAVVVSLGGVGSAVAAGTIGSGDIRNGAVHSVDIADQNVLKVDVGPNAVGYSELTGDVASDIKTGAVRQLESDGHYPGVTHLDNGDNSMAKWTADEGATLQSSWVMCAPGKTAIGGGFSRADEGVAAYRDLQIVTSRPAQFKGGEEVYNAIAGDPDGSFVPNAWLVEGFNNAVSGDVIVRPWVVCAAIK
ncbi:MAG: hypothetical protein WAN48_03445 [Actinomycetes bacterium]